MDTRFRKFDLTGKAALVTGGGTGLGFHMARALLQAGAQVMIASRREEVLRASVARLREETSSELAYYATVDLSEPQGIQSLVQRAYATLGNIDILIGNAGLDAVDQVDVVSDEAITAMCQVNIAANVSLVRAVLPAMRKRKWGRIIFSSSCASIRASAKEGMGMYAAVKGALNAFARAAAAEAGHDGITVNSLLFGIFETDVVRAASARLERATPGGGKAFYDSFSSMVMLGRWGSLEEIEGLIQFVASDAASYLTGTNLLYDGGLSAMLRPHAPAEAPVHPNWIAASLATRKPVE